MNIINFLSSNINAQVCQEQILLFSNYTIKNKVEDDEDKIFIEKKSPPGFFENWRLIERRRQKCSFAAAFICPKRKQPTMDNTNRTQLFCEA